MKPLSCFTLRRESAERAAPPRVLLYEGRPSGFHIDAAVLEAQFLVPPDLYLLFFTDDSPYEEGLRIVLMDHRFRLLDGLELGQWYTPGILSGLQPEGPERISFEFFPGMRMALRVDPKGLFQLVRRLPSFVRPLKRRLFSTNHLFIERIQPTQ
jgi:hypothetical protein